MTTPAPQVSVVIPTFNRADDLEHALRSVLDQSCRSWEAWVIDNHSTDRTDSVVAQFNDPRIRLLKIHNGGVIAASRNVGIAHARGEYVAFLDSDDWWTPDKLEAALQCLSRGADLTYHAMNLVRRRGQRVFWRRVPARALRAPVFADMIINGSAVVTSSVVVRRSIIRQIGGFIESPEMIAVEDYDAWLRIARLTDRFVRVPGVHGYYWLGGGNTSSPSRIQQSTLAFVARYSADVARLCPRGNPWWVDYTLARALFKLGDEAAAWRCLRALLQRRMPFRIRLRVVAMLVSLVGATLPRAAGFPKR